ncbi:MAG: hypothetical protein AMXMBFR47_34540 [Planctomycetota bacterium]
MTLVDAGPLIALLARRDKDHKRCLEWIDKLDSPLVTTLALLTEVMYFLGGAFGWHGQNQLWGMIAENRVELAEIDYDALRRCCELMEKYADVPMDFADATLVALAEQLDTRQIFTLDRHFRIYRFRGRRNFDVVP